MFIEYPDSKYNDGIEIDNYNGTWSLVAANEAKNGQIYKKWCFPQEIGTRDAPGGPKEKCLPWKIFLGSSAEAAIKMLENIIYELRNQAGIPASFGEGNEDGDIPF